VKRPPTDFELLKEIYTRYRDQFASFVEGAPGSRAAKIYVPLDLHAIANHFDVDDDSIFGRLYYHLDRKYGEPDDQKFGPQKSFFTPVAGPDQNCVNFPLLHRCPLARDRAGCLTGVDPDCVATVHGQRLTPRQGW